MPHFAIPAAGTAAFDEVMAEALVAPRPKIGKAVKLPRKPIARTAPDLTEPVQHRGEDWITFSRRWERSPFGRAKRAEADALREELSPPITHFAGRRRNTSAVFDRTESRFREP